MLSGLLKKTEDPRREHNPFSCTQHHRAWGLRRPDSNRWFWHIGSKDTWAMSFAKRLGNSEAAGVTWALEGNSQCPIAFFWAQHPTWGLGNEGLCHGVVPRQSQLDVVSFLLKSHNRGAALFVLRGVYRESSIFSGCVLHRTPAQRKVSYIRTFSRISIGHLSYIFQPIGWSHHVVCFYNPIIIKHDLLKC